jgi:hypothetical protein
MASLLPRFAPLLLLLLSAAASAQDLPKRDGGKEIDFLEPKLMLNDVGELPLPPGSKLGIDATALPLDVAKLTADVERAKKTSVWRAKLCKSGVLSKVEAESAALRVVRLAKDLEEARAEAARLALEELRKKGAPAEEIAAAEKNAEALAATAKESSDKWNGAQRAAAELNLQRQRKLYAVGAGSKSQVRKAEAALQTLTTAPTP